MREPLKWYDALEAGHLSGSAPGWSAMIAQSLSDLRIGRKVTSAFAITHYAGNDLKRKPKESGQEKTRGKLRALSSDGSSACALGPFNSITFRTEGLVWSLTD
jgi:hypothetical protein